MVFFLQHKFGKDWTNFPSKLTPVFQVKLLSTQKISVRDPWHFLVRIRIRGPVPQTNGSGPGSCSFRQWPSRHQQKVIFSCFFTYYFLKMHLHHSSKIKSHKEVTKQWKWRFFLVFLLNKGRIRIRIRTSDNWNWEAPKYRYGSYGSETLEKSLPQTWDSLPVEPHIHVVSVHMGTQQGRSDQMVQAWK